MSKFVSRYNTLYGPYWNFHQKWNSIGDDVIARLGGTFQSPDDVFPDWKDIWDAANISKMFRTNRRAFSCVQKRMLEHHTEPPTMTSCVALLVSLTSIGSPMHTTDTTGGTSTIGREAISLEHVVLEINCKIWSY